MKNATDAMKESRIHEFLPSVYSSMDSCTSFPFNILCVCNSKLALDYPCSGLLDVS